MAINITAPLSREKARQLRAGDSCLISGVIYTARDAAHKRLCELVDAGKEMPLDDDEKNDSNSAHDPTAFDADLHTAQFADLLRALETNTKPKIDVYEGKRSVDVILSIYESSNRGQTVTID